MGIVVGGGGFAKYLQGYGHWSWVLHVASGRPVLAEATGKENGLPCGSGFVGFTDIHEAFAGIAAIDGDYCRHSAAVRNLAHAYFDSAEILPRTLEASF